MMTFLTSSLAFASGGQSSVAYKDYTYQYQKQECQSELFDNGHCPDVPGGSRCAVRTYCDPKRLSEVVFADIPENKILKVVGADPISQAIWEHHEFVDHLSNEPLVRLRVYYFNDAE